jgi:hypothetical protein
MPVRQPNKGNGNGLVAWNKVAQAGTVMAVGLTQLTFYAIAVYGVAEVAFGHTQQHLHRLLALQTLADGIDHPNRKGGQRMAAFAGKEPINLLLADYAL